MFWNCKGNTNMRENSLEEIHLMLTISGKNRFSNRMSGTINKLYHNTYSYQFISNRLKTDLKIERIYIN